jgi:two-component system cell cycle response regulator DivK
MKTVPRNANTILLVDDYPDALEIYSVYLTYHGYRVFTACNGLDGIAAAHAHHPAVILMDIQMRGISGTEAMQRLRAHRPFEDVYIVALTAHALEEERTEALAAGFDAVLTKPCLPSELLTFVQDLLRQSRESRLTP